MSKQKDGWVNTDSYDFREGWKSGYNKGISANRRDAQTKPQGGLAMAFGDEFFGVTDHSTRGVTVEAVDDHFLITVEEKCGAKYGLVEHTVTEALNCVRHLLPKEEPVDSR